MYLRIPYERKMKRAKIRVFQKAGKEFVYLERRVKDL
jgi:hypothetical protein